MLALNTGAVQRKIAICFERLRNPDISVAALSEMFDLSETQIYRDLAWGKKTGYFGEEVKRTAIELRVQHSERAKQYQRQLKRLWRESTRVYRDLQRLRDEELPDEPDQLLYHLKAIAACESALSAMVRDEERLEGMIHALEKTQLEVSGIADAASSTALPQSVKVVLVKANGNGSIGSS